jgi:hypothetical protein
MDLKSTTYTLPEECQNCWNLFLNLLKIKFPAFAMYKNDTNEFFFIPETTDDYIAGIQKWIDLFQCSDAEDEYLENTDQSSTVNVIKPRNPTTAETLPLYTRWINKKSGEIFTNIDNTPLRNIWVGVKTGKVIRPLLQMDKFDILEDGSSLLFYPFENNLLDLGGKYHGQQKRGSVQFHDEIRGASAYLTNNVYIEVPALPLPVDFAISIWFKTRKPTKDICIVHVTQTGNNYLSAWATKSSLKVIINDQSFILKTMKSADWKKPHNIILQANGKAYLDGKLIIDSGIILDGTTVMLNPIIGADRDGGMVNDWYQGYVDDFRMFKRSITDIEASQLYESGTVLEEEE